MDPPFITWALFDPLLELLVFAPDAEGVDEHAASPRLATSAVAPTTKMVRHRRHPATVRLFPDCGEGALSSLVFSIGNPLFPLSGSDVDHDPLDM
ncbi:MAG: hypothetical protein ACRD6W_11490 [Nitrososphaerales archaeon]